MSVDKNNQTYKKTSFLTGVNSDYIEEYYTLYLQNPNLLTKDWIEFFDGLKKTQKYFTKYKRSELEPKKVKKFKIKEKAKQKIEKILRKYLLSSKLQLTQLEP